MTQTLTQRLQRVVALRDAASPAPWFRNIIGTGYGAAVLCSTAMRHSTESDKFRICTVPIYGNLEGNAELIAAAPSIVQLAVELGAEVERLKAEMVGLRAALADCAQVMRGVNAATEEKSVTERCSLLTIFRAETLSREPNAQ